MSGKKWMVGVSAVLVLTAATTGYMALAADYGSKEDPLVTLSYITDVLSPETVQLLEDKINSKATETEQNLDKKIADFSAQMDAKISEFQGQSASAVVNDEFIAKVAEAVAQKSTSAVSGGQSASAGWSVVKVANGKTIMLPLGTEVVLRLGSGECYSTGTTGLINLSTGSTLSNGQSVAANNLYLVTIEGGRGIKATADMTVMVSGSYTIK